MNNRFAVKLAGIRPFTAVARRFFQRSTCSSIPSSSSSSYPLPAAGVLNNGHIAGILNKKMDRVSPFGKIFSFYWPTSESDAEGAENKLLARLKTPYKKRLVEIEGNHHIHTLELCPDIPPNEAKHHLVMLHGFGAGLALWHNNFDSVANIRDVKTYAIDWLGMGRSSRPKFSINPKGEDCVEKTEDFFVNSLEQWRVAMGIEKMVLMGHSLGGYFSAVYAMRYPHRVERLIMVSPAGVAKKPDNHWMDRDDLPFWAKAVRWGWNRNITPQDLVRIVGPYGPELVRKYTTRRFAHLDNDHIDDITYYGYHINVRGASSEYALNNVLTLGAFARKPLIERMHSLNMPVLFLYGLHDWMDVQAGFHVVESLTAKGHPYAQTKIIPNAGHHLYLDNPESFNQTIEKFFRQTINLI